MENRERKTYKRVFAMLGIVFGILLLSGVLTHPINKVYNDDDANSLSPSLASSLFAHANGIVAEDRAHLILSLADTFFLLLKGERENLFLS